MSSATFHFSCNVGVITPYEEYLCEVFEVIQ